MILEIALTIIALYALFWVAIFIAAFIHGVRSGDIPTPKTRRLRDDFYNPSILDDKLDRI